MPPPKAGEPRAPASRDIIDLTGSDDEDQAHRPQPRTSGQLAHTPSSLPRAPAMQHGLPTFEAGPDSLEMRYGASGRNYSQAPLQSASRPSGGAAPRAPQPVQSFRRYLPLNGGFAGHTSSSNSVANDRESAAKRRKTAHTGSIRGHSSDSVVGARETIPSQSYASRPMAAVVDLTSTPAYAGRTMSAGVSNEHWNSRPLPSYEPRIANRLAVARESESEYSQELDPLVVCDDENDANLSKKVIKLIELLLKPYKLLPSEERKTILEKTAEHVIDLDLQKHYYENHGNFTTQYAKSINKVAKSYVESFVETLNELKRHRIFASSRASGSFTIVPQYNGSPTRKGSSSSSSTDDIFERHPSSRHPNSAGYKRPHSESPSTELSNDTVERMGAQNRQYIRREQANHIAAQTENSLRRSGRATNQDSQPAYVFKRRRRNPRSEYASESPAPTRDTLPIDLDDESIVVESSPDAELQEVVDDDEDLFNEYQPAKKPNSGQSERLLLTLLRQRESDGMAPTRTARGRPTFKASVSASLEDSFVQQSEWTDCSGDIVSISWITADTFLCGALAHLDSHNMQYNKPGNLLLGSTSKDTVRSFPNHRVPRPVVAKDQNAENALESMRQTQDPWIYSSVVSTAHCMINGYSFTSSFDETVKAWSIREDGSSMDLVGTWQHEGNVNFVVTSEHHDRVATASVLGINAVRVYDIDENSISESEYYLYGGNKTQEQTKDKWSYQPATIQWGIAPQVANLLLVGYSPRSDTGEDTDIPVDKKNTGELCVWNAETKEAVHIASSKSQNVFEVQWHPTQPMFVAATSPSGLFDGGITKTQIRLFILNESEVFTESRTFDCPALDINELTMMPNSYLQSYVTASCTDGYTYVYDTAQGDLPVHILVHGESLETLAHDLDVEVGDEGVKFAAWGRDTNRFYTGSSDGKLKAWDIKKPPGRAFIRDVLTLSGGIASGVFSKDFSKLVVGDATGKVHLLSIDDSDVEGSPIATIKDAATEKSGTTEISDAKPTLQQVLQQRNALLSANIRRPKLIVQHAEPAPPAADEYNLMEESLQTAQEIAQSYLNEGILEQHGAEGIYQGPNYAESGWFRYEAHEDYDSSQPLLPQFLAQQQFAIRLKKPETKFKCLPPVTSSDPKKHLQNTKGDLNLSPETREGLLREKAEIEEDFCLTYKYDLLPKSTIFKTNSRTRQSEERRIDGIET